VTDIQIASRALLPLLCLLALNARTLALLVASWGMSSKRTLWLMHTMRREMNLTRAIVVQETGTG